MPTLAILEPGHAPSAFPLPDGTHTIGRGPGRHIRIDDGSVSRLHATIEVVGSTVTVTDAQSRNGTFVNDRRVTGRTMLRIGQQLRCGDVRFELRDDIVRIAGPALVQAPLHATVADATYLASTAEVMLRSDASDRPQRQLEFLSALTTLLAESTSLTELRNVVLQTVSELIPVRRAALLSVEGDALVVEAHWGHGDDGTPFSRHIVGYVLENRQAALFDDAQGDERLAEAESVHDHDVRCAMAAPLLADDEVLGVLYVDNAVAAHTYGQSDLDLLLIVAGQVALSLRNARLQQLRSTYERFFPPTAIQRLLQDSSGAIEPSEMEVTALFADISGFTTMCESMAPVEVVELLNRYFPPMAQVVFDRGGMLEKYIGDALLAAWGAPYPHEDDADRAIEAALAMREIATGMGVTIHVGLHTGRVAFANIGSPEYVQFALIGDTTNLAARVCSEAPDGEIYATQATLDAAVREWSTESMGARTMKGKSAPTELVKILAPHP